MTETFKIDTKLSNNFMASWLCTAYTLHISNLIVKKLQLFIKRSYVATGLVA